jgi:surface antigen
MKNTAVRKANQVGKALRKQAQLRKTKPPAVLAEQAALNTVMLGRKGGVHRSEQIRRERLAQVAMKEA